MTPEGYWFTSSKFDIESGEDEINPRIYGRKLAAWLKERLETSGYAVEDIIAEDWGRCLMCSREPFMLWVGCSNVTDNDTAQPGDARPSKEDLIWHCFATAEVPFWKGLFRKVDTGPAVARLHENLGRILRSEPEITLVDEP